MTAVDVSERVLREGVLMACVCGAIFTTPQGAVGECRTMPCCGALIYLCQRADAGEVVAYHVQRIPAYPADLALAWDRLRARIEAHVGRP